MQRFLKSAIVLSIITAVAAVSLAPEAFAKRSRSRRSSSTHSRQTERGKGKRGRETGGRQAKRSKGKGSRGSRASRQELARDNHLVRERVVVRGRHGRRVVRYRYVRQRSDSESSTVASVPRASGAGIPSERVSEIQTALIKAGYLSGPPSGQYDDATVQAMRQFQASSGFPETGMPSAPALKKLGVAKRSNDGFAVPVNSVTEAPRKQPPLQTP